MFTTVQISVGLLINRSPHIILKGIIILGDKQTDVQSDVVAKIL